MTSRNDDLTVIGFLAFMLADTCKCSPEEFDAKVKETLKRSAMGFSWEEVNKLYNTMNEGLTYIHTQITKNMEAQKLTIQ